MQLSLLNFIKTGQFGGIDLGMSYIDLKRRLGSPSGWLENRHQLGLYNADVWRYGWMEFYFEARLIWYMQIEHFEKYYDNIPFELDYWLLHNHLKLDEAISLLEYEGIVYQIEQEKLEFTYQNQREVWCIPNLICESGVVLRFNPAEDEIDPLTLAVLSKKGYSSHPPLCE